MSCYRTYSHAGFPKGSYSIPNPMHFHIARQTQIAVRRPRLVTIAPHNVSSQYLFNHNRTPTVTLNFGHAHSVSVNLPFETLTGFIFPIASALNFRNITMSNSQGSQTSYMNNFEYVPPNNNELRKVNITPLHVDSYRTCHVEKEPLEKTDSFEQRVLDDLQQNMFTADFTSESERELSDVIEATLPDSDDNDIINFDEYDQINNESLVELTPEVIEMLPTSTSSSASTESKENNIYNNDSSPEITSQTNASKIATEIAEHFVDSILEDCENVELIGSVVNEAKGILKDISESVVVENSSVDEGIEDCTLTNDSVVKNSTLPNTLDEGVVILSQLILEYLIQQCFEIKELILFPEVLYDPNVVKLLSKLNEVFNEYYDNTLTSEQRNDLRIAIASHTLKLLEFEDQSNSSEESATVNTVSDKVFSISEFLNDILDHFFDSLEKEYIFTDLVKCVIDDEHNIFHSTPEHERQTTITKDQNSLDIISTGSFMIAEENNVNITRVVEKFEDLQVTSFQKRASKRSGSELYWIAVTNSPMSKKPKTPNRHIINVDDIPLRPPEYFETPHRTLSPIVEEPRVNLFDSSLSDPDIFTDVSVNTRLEISTSSEEDFVMIDNVLSDECNKLNSYVSFNKPEMNVAVCNSVNFVRTTTASANAFVQKKNAVFKSFDSENKENEPPSDDSGNWMGYDSAKF